MLQSYVKELGGRLKVYSMRHQVSFCERKDFNTEDVIQSLKVGKQSSQKFIKILSNTTYFQSCFSYFAFKNEKIIDSAIRHNLKELKKILSQYESRKFINSKMLEHLNSTLQLSLYAFSQKVRRIFFFL